MGPKAEFCDSWEAGRKDTDPRPSLTGQGEPSSGSRSPDFSWALSGRTAKKHLYVLLKRFLRLCLKSPNAGAPLISGCQLKPVPTHVPMSHPLRALSVPQDGVTSKETPVFPNRPQRAIRARRFYTTQASPAHWERVGVLASGHGRTRCDNANCHGSQRLWEQHYPGLESAHQTPGSS